MTDRPILFSAPMARALIAGTKTQTRRLLKPQPHSAQSVVSYDARSGNWMSCEPSPATGGTRQMDPWRPIRIRISDRLWVREAWRAGKGYDAYPPREMSHWPVHYEADGPPDADDDMGMNGRLRASMHMPRWASRLTLTVTDVRVQRLHDISEADAWAEGCAKGHPDDVGGFFPAEEPHPSGKGWSGWDNARDWYADLWDRINGEGSWDANPWVVAYSFTVERRNIDAEIGAMDEDFDHDPGDSCPNCGGEGLIYMCFDECACVDPESGCDECERTCDWCKPRRPICEDA